jgi:hypothetical protein
MSYVGDLFLDPDTGLGFPSAEAAHNEGRPLANDHAFVYRSELARLIGNSNRLIVVYQHKHQGQPNEYISTAKVLLNELGLASFAYSLTHISFLFLSRPGDRLTRLQRFFEQKLRGAPDRIM